MEIPVAMDGLSVMVNPVNDFVECMTIDELHTLWAPEAEDTIMKWSQVREGWPDRDVNLYGPGVDSGTFDYFTETVNGESQASRGDFLASEDDNVLVTGISRDRNGLGYFGYAYYAENAGRLKLVAIDGGDGCIAPSNETINNGSYAPLSRPLFIYVRGDALDEPQIKGFIEYYLAQASRPWISRNRLHSLPGHGLRVGAGQVPQRYHRTGLWRRRPALRHRRASAPGLPVTQQPGKRGGRGLARPWPPDSFSPRICPPISHPNRKGGR